jgi:hypothetical protein
MPMDQMATWQEQIMEAGYFAAMTKQPFDPFAMDEWKIGFHLFHDSQAFREARESTLSTSIAA